MTKENNSIKSVVCLLLIRQSQRRENWDERNLGECLFSKRESCFVLNTGERSSRGGTIDLEKILPSSGHGLYLSVSLQFSFFFGSPSRLSLSLSLSLSYFFVLALGIFRHVYFQLDDIKFTSGPAVSPFFSVAIEQCTRTVGYSAVVSSCRTRASSHGKRRGISLIFPWIPSSQFRVLLLLMLCRWGMWSLRDSWTCG